MVAYWAGNLPSVLYGARVAASPSEEIQAGKLVDTEYSSEEVAMALAGLPITVVQEG